MFVFDVILSMSLLAKIGATHCALELHLSVLRLKFLNVIDKHLSGLTCKLRNCRYQQQADTHNIQTSNTTYQINPRWNTTQFSRNASISGLMFACLFYLCFRPLTGWSPPCLCQCSPAGPHTPRTPRSSHPRRPPPAAPDSPPPRSSWWRRQWRALFWPGQPPGCHHPGQEGEAERGGAS